MRYLLFSIAFVVSIFACKKDPVLSNDTRPGGYAMGEKIRLDFSLATTSPVSDSIDVSVWEKKTGYIYALRAGLGNVNKTGKYSCYWDGRKPDGRWPEGGHYLVYATIDINQTIYSDTVEIGLAD